MGDHMKHDDIRTAPGTRQFKVFFTSPLASLNRRSAEKKLIAYISLGNPSLLTGHMKNEIEENLSEVIGNLPSVPLTQAKFHGNALITQGHLAAVNAGVPEDTAQRISDLCMRKYEEMTDPAVQWQLAKETLLLFCEAVRDAEFRLYSPAVRECCEYIQQNLHRSISLDELGQVCHLSPHYVSDIFRKELGIGALQYVHQVKMQYAKFLLMNSDLGIAEISVQLSYPSHSNFSQRFKRVYGITPNEFRISCGK